MCEQKDELSKFEQILVRAREWQIERLESAFKAGFSIPEQICEKYRQRYLLECQTDPEDVESNQYTLLFAQFLEEICAQLEIPSQLNSLDLITLFGEICTGEYSRSSFFGQISSTIH